MFKKYKLLSMISMILLLTSTTYSQIVYTDINPDATTQLDKTKGSQIGVVSIDFDQDKTEEYNFRWIFYKNGWSIQMPSDVDREIFFNLNGNKTGAFGYRLIQPMTKGTLIDFKANWGRPANDPIIAENTAPNFQNLGDRYVGCRFTLGTNTHYGWVRVTFDNTLKLTVKDYAYNKTPDTPIKAGATTEPVVDISDTNFKNALLANTKINTNGDKEIQVSEANSYTGELNVRRKRIVNMKGLEAFTKITKLNCSRNQITNIDLSKNTLLQSLDINGNRTLPSLDVTHNTLMTFLDLRSCKKVTSIDLSKNTLLSKLDCGLSGIKTLDVRNNPALTQLSAIRTGFTSLDLTNNPKLTYLKIYANKLKTIDLSKNVLLEQLFIQDNNLASLDVKTNTKLTKLVCFNNEIPKLDLATNTQLEFINCSNNKFTTLDISKNINLTKLYSKNNGHTSLDFSKNTKLIQVHVSGNKLTAIDLSNHPALTHLTCETNPVLASINVTKSTSLKELQCFNTSLKSLDLSNHPNLSTLKFNDNPHLTDVNLKNGNSTKPFRFFFNAKNLPALTCLQVDAPEAFKKKYKSRIDANKLDVIKSDCIKKEVKVQKITIAGVNKINKKGGEIKLTATVLPDNATNKELKWTVDKATLATLEVKTDHVLLMAKADGVVTLTATAEDGSGVNAEHKVTITNQGGATDVDVQKITIAGVDKIDKKGGEIKLTATILPDNATNKELKWTVDKATLATLEVKTDHVLLTAKANGVVTLTATAEDGSGVNAEHKVTITNQGGATDVDVQKITIAGVDKIDKKDGNIVLLATILPGNATNKKLTWKIDKADLAILTVAKNEQVLLTAKADGEVTVTATAEDGSGVSAAHKVTITNQGGATDVDVQKITIAGVDKIDKKGGEIKLTATVLPDNATNKELKWTVDKATLATLEVKTDHVLLTAKANGVATLTATAEDGSGVNAEHKVTITNQNITSIDDVNTQSDLVLYPNPAQNRLTIDTNLAISSIDITDLAGKTVKKALVSQSIDIEDLRPNIYFIQIHTDNKVIVRKFVKE